MEVPQNIWWFGGAATIFAAVFTLVLKKWYFDMGIMYLTPLGGSVIGSGDRAALSLAVNF